MLAVELKDFDQVKAVISSCMEQGISIDWFLFAEHCLRIAPPLIIDKESIRFACATILNALNEIS